MINIRELTSSKSFYKLTQNIILDMSSEQLIALQNGESLDFTDFEDLIMDFIADEGIPYQIFDLVCNEAREGLSKSVSDYEIAEDLRKSQSGMLANSLPPLPDFPHL